MSRDRARVLAWLEHNPAGGRTSQIALALGLETAVVQHILQSLGKQGKAARSLTGIWRKA